VLDVLHLYDHKRILLFAAVGHPDYFASQKFVPSQFVQNYRRIGQVNVPQTKFHVMVSKIHRPLAFISAGRFSPGLRQSAYQSCRLAKITSKPGKWMSSANIFRERLPTSHQTGKEFRERS